MSNSSELFLINEDSKEEIKFDLLKRPVLEFEDHCLLDITTSQDSNEERRGNQEQQGKDDDYEREEKECSSADSSVEAKRKTKLLGELNATEDENDGFKTPTSLDHKIPSITECPPAPRKPIKPLLSKKRKASSSSSSPSRNVRRSLQLVLSQEVESLFLRPVFGDFQKKMDQESSKRSR